MRLLLPKRLLRWSFLLLLTGVACQQTEPAPPVEPPTPPTVIPPTPEPDPIPVNDSLLSYLALGDSYTIGTGVTPQVRWPTQLRDSLQQRGLPVQEPVYIARNGSTTDELLNGITNFNYPDTFDMVSLLIGVNNQFRGYTFSQYQEEFLTLFQTALDAVQGRRDRFFVVSIPDYGVTPFGQFGDPQRIAEELDAYNEYARQVCRSERVRYVYITDISREARTDPDLLAPDDLHPSGEQYRRWVARMVPGIDSTLR